MQRDRKYCFRFLSREVSFAIPLLVMALAGEINPQSNDSDFGANDLRISTMGGLGLSRQHAVFDPRVAFNSADKQYLVVWSGNENSGDKTVVFGQFIDAITGRQIGDDQFLANRDVPTIFTQQGTANHNVAYNSLRNEFLIVFTETAVQDSSELEIYGQRISASGMPLGDPAVRISDMGEDGDRSADVFDRVGIAYNSNDDEYLIVWRGDDVGNQSLVDGEFEIFGQRLGYDGSDELVEVGGNDFQISDVGGANGENPQFGAGHPVVVHSATDNQYLAVWQADESEDGLHQIYGQLLEATGVEIGDNDFQISSGFNGVERDVVTPSVTHNTTTGEYLVAWAMDQESSGVYQVHAQLLSAAGTLVESTQLQVSSNGTVANPANQPEVVYNNHDNEYLVSWQGSLLDAPGELEIFGQRLSANGAAVGPDDFRISDLGPDSDIAFHSNPGGAVAYSGSDLNSYLVVWYGSDDREGQVLGELEIFGQVIEPVLDIDKRLTTPNQVAGVGDTVRYQIEVFHKQILEGSDLKDISLRDALNVAVSDDVPLEDVRLISAEVQDGASTADVSDLFNVNESDVLETVGELNLLRETNGMEHQNLTILLEGRIKDQTAMIDSFANTAFLAWQNSAGLEHPAYIDSATTARITVVTSVENPRSDRLPSEYALHANYPNPFNPTTTIIYELPTQSRVRLEIFNMLGQRVRSIVQEKQAAGVYKVQWDGLNDVGKPMSSGVYVVRLLTEKSGTESNVIAKKLTLLR